MEKKRSFSDLIKKKSKNKTFRNVVISLFILIIALTVFLTVYVVDGLPSLEELENPKTQLASNVYDRNGQIITQFFRLEKRREIELDSVPKYLVDALIATEDTKFYSHWGVNLERFAKAMFKTFFLGKKEGGSTITQQLAKNLYGFKGKNESKFETLVRKIREWITAVQIEKNYTKDEILEMYLNTSYLGRGAYGVSTAARTYFKKRIQELTLPECALLIGLINLPGKYDPARNYEAALRKRNQILANMVEHESLTESEFNKLKQTAINLPEFTELNSFGETIAPHFAEYIRRQVEKEKDEYGFDPYEDGLAIHTTLDLKMQAFANNAVQKHLEEFQKLFDKYWKWEKHQDILYDKLNKAIKSLPKYISARSSYEKEQIYNYYYNDSAFIDSCKQAWQKIEVGFVVLDVKTGEVRAMVGGRNMKNGRGLNHVTQILRQPGSAFKPVVYTTAIENGLYPAYPILNEPFTDVDGWSPRNFESDEYGGYVTLRNALKESLNLVSARLILENYAELWKIGKVAKDLGINSKLNLYKSISLGTSEIKPIELASAYATLANRGVYIQPLSIKRIEDKNKMLISSYKPETREAVSEETAYIMLDMLRTVIKEGTGQKVRWMYNFYRDCGGKTGTTQDYRNAWFAGATPQLAGVVWVGFDDERISFEGPGAYGQGSKAALPIWGQFFKDVYEQMNLPEETWEMPASGEVTYMDFCMESITKFGIPKIYGADCNSGKLTDLIKMKDIPDGTNRRDSSYIPRNVNKFTDSVSHEAIEIR